MNITRDIQIDWGVTALAGTLACRVVDPDDGNLIARTTAGVTEFPAGSGLYHVKITTWDPTWIGRVVWDDGLTTVGHVASESFDASPAASVTVVPATSVIINSVVDVTNGCFLTLVQGDDHTEGDRLPSWTFTNYTGPSLVGATGVLRLRKVDSYNRGIAGTADLEVVATIVQVGTTVTVQAPITAAQSAGLSTVATTIEATHEYQILATTAGGKDHTLKLGRADVIRRIDPRT